jgi:hypothetical protein
MKCWQKKGTYFGRTKAPINKPRPLWKRVPIGQSVLVALSYLPLRAMIIFSSASSNERIFSPQGRTRPRHTPRPAKERMAPPTREKAEGLFIVIAAAEAPSHASTCKLRTDPGHTHPRQPLRFSACWQHPESFVLPNNFFRFFVVAAVRCFRALPRWCQHQIVTTAQNADVVVTQTRISRALPRWCQQLSSRFRVCECKRATTTITPTVATQTHISWALPRYCQHAISSNSRKITKRTARNGNQHPTGTSQHQCRRNPHGTGPCSSTQTDKDK